MAAGGKVSLVLCFFSVWEIFFFFFKALDQVFGETCQIAKHDDR